MVIAGTDARRDSLGLKMLVLWRETFMNEVTILGASDIEIKARGPHSTWGYL
jgi:hypothetical protein